MAVQHISAQEAKVGMVLAEPIHDQQGRVIMAAGNRLTPVHVKRLDRWGVSELCIATEEADVSHRDEEEGEDTLPAAQQLDQEYMAEVAQEFNARFSASEGNALMEHLKRVAFKTVVLAGRGGVSGVH